MNSNTHRIAAFVAITCITIFFSSTILVEIFGTNESIVRVKTLIVFPGLLFLIPAIILTGSTGIFLAKDRNGLLVNYKKRRMPFIGANGLLILIPAAIYLDQMASTGSFNTKFYVVQGVELLAGAINIALMSMNIRDGFKMTCKSK